MALASAVSSRPRTAEGCRRNTTVIQEGAMAQDVKYTHCCWRRAVKWLQSTPRGDWRLQRWLVRWFIVMQYSAAQDSWHMRPTSRLQIAVKSIKLSFKCKGKGCQMLRKVFAASVHSVSFKKGNACVFSRSSFRCVSPSDRKLRSFRVPQKANSIVVLTGARDELTFFRCLLTDSCNGDFLQAVIAFFAVCLET